MVCGVNDFCQRELAFGKLETEQAVVQAWVLRKGAGGDCFQRDPVREGLQKAGGDDKKHLHTVGSGRAALAS